MAIHLSHLNLEDLVEEDLIIVLAVEDMVEMVVMEHGTLMKHQIQNGMELVVEVVAMVVMEVMLLLMLDIILKLGMCVVAVEEGLAEMVEMVLQMEVAVVEDMEEAQMGELIVEVEVDIIREAVMDLMVVVAEAEDMEMEENLELELLDLLLVAMEHYLSLIHI